MMLKKSLITIGVAMMSLQQVQAFGPVDVVYVFAGFMDGVIHKDNLAYLLGCMNGTDSLVVDIENAVTHFKQGGATGIGLGIMDIGKFLQDLPPTVYNCGGIPEDFAKLGNFFSIFNDTAKLTSRITYNLIWYYSDINAAVQQALDNWANSLFYDFGKKIGEALVLAIGDHSVFINIPPTVEAEISPIAVFDEKFLE